MRNSQKSYQNKTYENWSTGHERLLFMINIIIKLIFCLSLMTIISCYTHVILYTGPELKPEKESSLEYNFNLCDWTLGTIDGIEVSFYEDSAVSWDAVLFHLLPGEHAIVMPGFDQARWESYLEKKYNMGRPNLENYNIISDPVTLKFTTLPDHEYFLNCRMYDETIRTEWKSTSTYIKYFYRFGEIYIFDGTEGKIVATETFHFYKKK